MDNIIQDMFDEALRNPNNQAISIVRFRRSLWINDTKQSREKNLNLTIYEFCMTAFIIIFLINCYFGKSQNEYFSRKWFNSNKSFYFNNYSHIGHENNYSNFNIKSPFL